MRNCAWNLLLLRIVCYQYCIQSYNLICKFWRFIYLNIYLWNPKSQKKILYILTPKVASGAVFSLPLEQHIPRQAVRLFLFSHHLCLNLHCRSQSDRFWSNHCLYLSNDTIYKSTCCGYGKILNWTGETLGAREVAITTPGPSMVKWL